MHRLCWRSVVPLVVACSVLVACSSDEKKPLPGDRLDVLSPLSALAVDSGAAPVALTTPWANADWAQVGGNPGHAMEHLALAARPLKHVWSADLGAGSRDESPLTAQPIVVAGRVYAMDSDNQLACLDLQTGKRYWQVYVGARGQDDTAVGGGMSADNARLYIANGFAQVVALTLEGGQEVWRTALPAPSRSAPTVLDGRVYVTLLDGQILALDAQEGHVIWTYRGVSGEGARVRGLSSPAVTADLVIAPFPSGELAALRPDNGAVAWTDHLSPAVRLGGLSMVSDIRALPVVSSGVVVALSYSDRLVAIDTATGSRLWQRDIGGQDTPWVVGDTVFVLAKTAQVLALDLHTGALKWVHDLPRFEDPDSKSDPIFWTGPVVAGGVARLFATNSHVMDLNPVTGAVMGQWSVEDPPIVPVVVADETLLIVGADGTLSAWR